MRSETEKYNLILDIANNNDRIRALYMNGSEADASMKFLHVVHTLSKDALEIPTF